MSPDFRITLALSIQETDLILGALSELPFKTSADIIGKIRTTAFAQIEQAKAPAEVSAPVETPLT
jgi:hypothetical protein